jgi:FkbM family methyltransferase
MMELRLSRLETLSQGAKAVYVGNDRVLVKANFLDIVYLVEADDRLIVPRFMMKGVHEPEITSFFIRNIGPEDNALDLGANFGYYSCLMGRCAHLGKTIALEPDQKIFELMRDNVYINGLESCVTPIRAAASDVEGVSTLYRRSTRSGNTSMIMLPEEYTTAHGEIPAEAFDSPAIPVDTLLEDFGGRLDFIKIDVEGAEPLVFRGARETIARNHHIRIVMEWAPDQIRAAGFDLAAFTEELAAMGLKPALIGQTVPEQINWAALLAARYLSGVLLTVKD